MNTLFENFPEFSDTQKQKFEKLLEIFIETNSQINLSAVRDKEGIIQKHFLDSLLLTDYVDLEGNVLDLWSGGGFPGLPLKIFYGNKISMTLVDSVAKKMWCVQNFIQELDITHCATKVGRAENLGRDGEYREKYDFVVSRAMAYFPTLLEYALPLVKVGGYFIAYKLEDEKEISDGKNALKKLGGRILEVHNYDFYGQKRSFVFVEKIKKTPINFPRKVGEPLKFPLL